MGMSVGFSNPMGGQSDVVNTYVKSSGTSSPAHITGADGSMVSSGPSTTVTVWTTTPVHPPGLAVAIRVTSYTPAEA